MMIVPPDVSDRLLAECLGRPMAYDALRDLCDQIGGRTSGAVSGDRAEAWAARHLESSGLERVRCESLEIPVWERGSLVAEVIAPQPRPLNALAHGFAPDHCDVTAPIVDAGCGLPEEYDRIGELARDALALCDETAPPGKRNPHRTERLAWAVERGAAGLIIAGATAGCLPRTGVCHRNGSPIPSIGLTAEDAGRLRRDLEAGVRPKVRIRMSNTTRTGTARNVLADIGGAEDRHEIVLAGAHLDSWDVAQGATDNGIGCAIVLQAARALMAVGRTPRRSIRFALWAAEETGLRGSRQYVSAHADELGAIAAVMNFDMTGDPSGYWLPGVSEPPRLFRDLAQQLAPLGMRPEFTSQAALHSDHQPFMLEGVPIVGLNGPLPESGGGRYYHSAGDTFEKVSQPALCRAAAVAAHTLWAIADAPELPIRRLSRQAVRRMIARAGLTEAVEADTA